jgi:membrane-bound ClpP family serine protease
MPGPDRLPRCPWALSATECLAYHDIEWGRPVTSVRGLAPLSGVAALLAGWTPMGVVFLLLGIALLLGGVAALRDGWTPVGVVFLLLGIAALLGGVALLYRPELPRRLVAWLPHETICRSQQTVTTGISSIVTRTGAAARHHQ